MFTFQVELLHFVVKEFSTFSLGVISTCHRAVRFCLKSYAFDIFLNILNFHETTSPLKLLRFRAKFVILFFSVVYNYYNLHPN